MARPLSIVNFERCYLGAFALGVVNVMVQWGELQAKIAAMPNSAMLGPWFFPMTIAFGWGITLLLWYFTAHRRASVTKWIIAVFFGLSVLSVVGSLLMGTLPSGLAGVIAIVAFVMNGVAVWFLFRPDANAWFAGKPTDLGDTFS